MAPRRCRIQRSTPHGSATVSALKEETQFAAAGVGDTVYAVGIAPAKLAQMLALRAQGVDLAVVPDTVAQAAALAAPSGASPPIT
jgi:D-serine deaminase-like pyridoxal phosphate-dependent protein